MSQHAKQLYSFVPADWVSSHQRHFITLPFRWDNCPYGGELQYVWFGSLSRLLRIPVKGAKWLVLRGQVCSVWQYCGRKAPTKGHTVSFRDGIMGPSKMLSGLVNLREKKKRWSWNNLGRETIGFFISWHKNEWIFIPKAKQAWNPRTINGETSIPGTITGCLCVLTVKTVPQGFKETCGLLFLFLSKQN